MGFTNVYWLLLYNHLHAINLQTIEISRDSIIHASLPRFGTVDDHAISATESVGK